MRRSRVLVATTVLTASLLSAPEARPKAVSAGALQRLSAADQPGNGDSRDPVVAAGNPSVVAFLSNASNLTGVSESRDEVVVSDRGVLSRPAAHIDLGDLAPPATDTRSGDLQGQPVSRASQAGPSTSPSLSADGRFIAFLVVIETESGVWPVRETRVAPRIFVWDRTKPTAVLIAEDPGTQAIVERVVISPDGGTVAFVQGGSVYVQDVLNPDQAPTPLVRGRQPSLARGGTTLAFTTADPVVPEDTNATDDVYVLSGTSKRRASVDSTGREGDGPSRSPSLSADGTKVAFESFATNLVAGDANGTADVFVHDMGGGTTLASLGGAGQGDGPSTVPSLSGDGRYVAFASAATNLVVGDGNGRDPAGATETNFAIFGYGASYGGFAAEPALTYARGVRVDGNRVVATFPTGVGTAVGATVAPRAVIDFQVVPVGVRDGRSNANPVGAVGGGPGGDTRDVGLSSGPYLSRPSPSPSQPAATARSPLVLRAAAAQGPATFSTVHPDLRSVTAHFRGNTAKFCFDEDVSSVGPPERFHLQGYNSTVQINAQTVTPPPAPTTTSTRPPDAVSCVEADFGRVIAGFTLGVVDPGAVSGGSRGSPNLAASVRKQTESDNSLRQSVAAAQSPGPFAGRTTGPDATGASTSGAFDNAINYSFDDSPLSSTIDPSRFGFVDDTGRSHRGRTARNSGLAIVVTFDAADPVATATRYFVEESAVFDSDDTGAGFEHNPSQSTAGTTAAPDLTSAALATTSPVPQYKLRFDAPVTRADPARIAFYTEDGTRFAPASAAPLAGNRQLVRASVPAVAGFTDQVVLLGVEAGAATGGTAGVAQPSSPGTAVLAEQLSGDTDAPDLVNATFDTATATVTYTFDEPVNAAHLSPDQPAVADLPRDVFVRDLATGRTIRASDTAAGVEAHGDSGAPSLSGDGRFVAFDSMASDLVPGDVATARDVFERDLLVATLAPSALDLGSAVVGGATGSEAVRLTNSGFGPLHVGSVTLAGVGASDFGLRTDGCSRRTLQPLQSCLIDVHFAPDTAGVRQARVVVADDARGSPRAVTLRGVAQARPAAPSPADPRLGPARIPAGVPAGGPPSIALDPSLGPPGTVVSVLGQGFPAGDPVELQWTNSADVRGTWVPLGTPVGIVANADGRFGPVPVLILPHEMLGPRLLEAIGAPPDSRARADFLVVPGTVQPAGVGPGQTARQVLQLLRRNR